MPPLPRVGEGWGEGCLNFRTRSQANLPAQSTELDASHLCISGHQIRGPWAVSGDPIEGDQYSVTVHVNEGLVK